MYLKIKKRQHRRDFTGIFACEHCNYEIEASGYDDVYFHETVIPGMTCKNCGKIASSMTPKTKPDVHPDTVL